MSDKNTNPNTEQQSITPTPEDKGGPGGEKMFTQADLDRIIGERLARAKQTADSAERETVLKARESRLDCREFLSDKHYPVELLDILDTSDSKTFQENVERLAKLFQRMEPATDGVRVNFGTPLTGNPSRIGEAIANAFKPPKI